MGPKTRRPQFRLGTRFGHRRVGEYRITGSPGSVDEGTSMAEGDGSGVPDDVVSDPVVAFDGGVAWGGFG